ncbi:hypothetical protein MNBD_GAMMA04-1753 [hydrothermal vent metagenome]|uniref:DUF945 domain-containing protein n=1 Tax=hydrothermal vent metagenome TaxID=652676 RepID=A0A3B0W6N0_9ZZZZ
MKKAALLFLLLIPVVWAGLTWLSSDKTELIFDNMLAQSEYTSTMIHSNQKTTFEKGFLNSSATSEMMINIQNNLIKVPLKHKIYHGPIMLTPNGLKYGASYILTKLDMSKIASKQKAILTTIFMDKEPFVQGVKFNFGSGVDMEQAIAPVQFDRTILNALSERSKRSKSSLNILLEDGIHSTFITNLDNSALSGVVEIGQFTVTAFTKNNDPIEIHLSPSTSHIQMDEIYKGNMLSGEFKWYLPNLNVSVDLNELISTKGLLIKGSSATENALFSSDFLVKADSFIIHAPLVPEKLSKMSLIFHSKLYGFNANGLKPFLDTFMKVAESESDDIKQPTEAQKTLLISQLKDLIQTNSGVSQIIEINTDQGGFKLEFDLHYASKQPLKELASTEDIFKALKGTLTLHQDKNMISGTILESLFAFPMVSRFLQSSDQTLQSKITLENGLLTINDQESISVLNLFDSAFPKTADPL